jgi:hypothetical protein
MADVLLAVERLLSVCSGSNARADNFPPIDQSVTRVTAPPGSRQ